MSGPIACRLCGRAFEPRRTGSRHCCAPCTARAVKDAAKPRRIQCRECGREFAAPHQAVRYCSDPCRKKGYARHKNSIARRPTRSRGGAAKCRACGKEFAAPTRSVRYCSDPCRKDGYARHRARWQPRPARKGETLECRACGRAFESDRGPGRLRVYCSAECRAEGERAYIREYMRRYLADPERRAVQAARVRASAARRRAGKKGGR